MYYKIFWKTSPRKKLSTVEILDFQPITRDQHIQSNIYSIIVPVQDTHMRQNQIRAGSKILHYSNMKIP